MGVRVLYDSKQQEAVLFDSTGGFPIEGLEVFGTLDYFVTADAAAWDFVAFCEAKGVADLRAPADIAGARPRRNAELRKAWTLNVARRGRGASHLAEATERALDER